VPATNSGGRTTFQNAPGGTQRRGIELGLDARLGRDWTARLAADWLRARFEEGYGYTSQGRSVSVAAGNRLPGVPGQSAFLEIAWRGERPGLSAALESRYLGGVAVDDANSDETGGTPVFAARLGWRARNGLRAVLRADNLADRVYAGSVIVNDANGRHFEPAAGRSVYLGLRYDGRID
jgi:iron complex outermembrane receptor protein